MLNIHDIKATRPSPYKKEETTADECYFVDIDDSILRVKIDQTWCLC
jgi:hypothetical protein